MRREQLEAVGAGLLILAVVAIIAGGLLLNVLNLVSDLT